MWLCVCVFAQLCPTLCISMDCSLPDFSAHGIFQARILEPIAISYSRGSFRPRDPTRVSCISCIGRLILPHCGTWEALIWLWWELNKIICQMGSLVAQWYRISLPQEMRVLSLGREDPWEKETATHSSILARRIPRTEEPGRVQSMGSQRIGHNWALTHDV